MSEVIGFGVIILLGVSLAAGIFVWAVEKSFMLWRVWHGYVQMRLEK